MRRTLCPIDNGTSGKITLPKGELELDGVVDENGDVERRPVDIRSKGRGRYEIVILDDELSPLDASEEIESSPEPETAD